MNSIRTVNVESVSRDICNVCGHEVRCTWDGNGAHANLDDLRAIRDAGHANWSNQEIADIAYHVETRMDETYASEYRIAYMMEATGEFEVVETFRAASDADANAYAEANHDGEWYVLDSAGRNINAGIDG
jgi:hypothetical protein